MSFQVSALSYEPFAELFSLGEVALAERKARLVIAEPGSPCRVSLDDARRGERLLLINHVHQPADSPFRSSHAIFIREHAVQARPAVGAIPPALAARLLSLRAFDAGGNIVAADVVEGADAGPAIKTLLEADGAAYVHAHYARYGCTQRG